MATTFYNRTSSVEDFLKSHKSKLNDDKLRLRGRDSAGPVIGILPTDEGRSFTSQQKAFERRNEYRQHLNDKENYTTDSRHDDTPISDIRRKMQRKREEEISFGNDQDNPIINQRVGVAKPAAVNQTVTPDNRQNNVSLMGLGSIGLRQEESPEEKRQRQSKYRSELIEQIQKKNNKTTTAKTTRMGSTRLFHEEDEAPRHREHHSKQHFNDEDRSKSNGGQYRSRREPVRARTRHRNHGDDDDDDDDGSGVNDDYPHYRPSQYKGYPPYYPPPPGPPSQYHISPYYYPTPYPHMYPPPHPPHMPHQSHQNMYYAQDMAYSNDPYRRPRERSPPRVQSPIDYSMRSRQNLTDPYKEERRNRERPNSSPKDTTDKTSEFRAVLDKQIKEKKEREKKEKRDLDTFYNKIEAEAEVYDPWGKPGGGAPLTDPIGNVVTERGQLRKSYDDKVISPRISDEDRKKMLQDKTRRDLEEQIKDNQERQMKEKYKQQLQEEIEELKILQELKKLNTNGQVEETEVKKKLDALCKQQQQSTTTTTIETTKTPALTAQEIAEQKFKVELERKRKKQEEEEEQLNRLAEKMASDSKPSWKQRSSSPPIPTLRNKPSVQIPAYPSANVPPRPSSNVMTNNPMSSVPTHPSSYVPTHPSSNGPANPSSNGPTHPSSYVPANGPANPLSYGPAHPSSNGPTHPLSYVPANGPANPLSYGPAHPSSNGPTHPTYQVPFSPQTDQPSSHVPSHPSSPPIPTLRPRRDSHNNSRQRNSLSRPAGASHVTTIDHPSSSTGQQIPNVQMQPPSKELLKGFSDLKNHIRKSMIATAADSTTHNRPRMAPPTMTTPTPASFTQFNQLKFNRPKETRAKLLNDHPEPPRTNTALEMQQQSLLRLQQRNGSDQSRFSIHDSQSDVRLRPPTSVSNYTIATMDIDSLANRNEERARRLEAILNANDRGSQRHNPQAILDQFLYNQRSERRPHPFNEDN